MKKIMLTVAMLALLTACNEEETQINEVEKAQALNVTERGCGSDYMLAHQLRQDSTLVNKMEAFDRNANNVLESSRIVNDVIEIPVAVNVIYNLAAENISQAQIQSQIDVLNKDFNATNSDYNTANNPYSSVRANVGIRFVLDQIIRKQSTRTVWYSEDQFMKTTTNGGIAPTSPTTKLNMWIVNDLKRKSDNSQLLGYAQFPGGAAATDGYVCENYCVGTIGTAKAPYNLGRTATHEIGHWMNLRHIWGDTTCGSDLVSDTPTHDSANFGAPAVGHKSTCSGAPLEMYMNYMDYVDDSSMYMFSAGQKSRMLAIFAVGGSRASFR